MARTSSSSASPVPGRLAALGAARPYWNPYIAGFALGLVLLVTLMTTGRGLAASSGFAAVATWFASLGSVAQVEANAVHASYWNGGAPLQSWTLAFVAFLAFAGWGMGRLEKSFARLRPAPYAD